MKNKPVIAYQTVFYLLIPLLIIGIYGGYTSFPICILFLIIRLMISNKDTVGFYLLMFGGPVAGLIRTCYPFIPIYGIVVLCFSILILNRFLRSFLKDCLSSIGYMTFVYIVFFISYLLAKSTPYADNKIFNIVYHGSTMLFAFYVYCKSIKMSSEDLSQLLLLTSIIYIVGNITIYRFSVGTMFDYDWLRSQFENYRMIDGDGVVVGYQKIGMLALLGYSFFMSNKSLSKNKIILYSLITFQIIMTSGARQAMLGLLVVIFIRFVYFNTKSSLKKIGFLILALGGAMVFYLIIMNVGGAYVHSLEKSGGGGRELIYLDTFRLISIYPLLGVGLGGFPLHSWTADWPHNMILEIICETGLIGFGLLFITILIFILSKRVSFNTTTKNDNYYFLFIIALGIRYMISSDLGESIELFSALFAVVPLTIKKHTS